jgi:excisionase family DNA binding protein
MQNLVFTQLSIPEVRQLFREELKTFFAENQINQTQSDADEIGGVELAMQVTGKAKPTIYDLVHKRQIPHSKRGKHLYFSKRELLEWISSGKRKTASEIKLDAQSI